MGARIDLLRSGRWRVRLTLPGTPKPPDTFEYEYEARDWADLNDPASPNYRPAGLPQPPKPVEPGQPTGWQLRDHIADWLIRHEAHDVTKGTMKGYTYELGFVADSVLGEMDVALITSTHVERWIGEMKRAGIPVPTRNRRLKRLRQVMTDAARMGLTKADPTAGIKFQTAGIREGVRLTKAEQAALLAACGGDTELRAMVALALYCGLRWSEVAALTPACFDGGLIVVRQAVEKSTGELRKYPKGKRPRVVPVPNIALPYIGAVLAAARLRGHHALLFTPKHKSGKILEKPLAYNNWRARRFAPAVTRAGITMNGERPVLFHDLRHTYGSTIVGKMDVAEVARLMGHSATIVTARYLHAGTDEHRAELVAAAFA